MIEMSKKYKTRNGREVRIYATDGSDSRPIHGAYLYDGEWIANTWNAYGDHKLAGGENSLDLIEVKPKRTLDVWLNVHADDRYVYATKGEADRGASNRCIACLHIVREYEEGEGLE